jgi:3-phosphoglycerate kinase
VQSHLSGVAGRPERGEPDEALRLAPVYSLSFLELLSTYRLFKTDLASAIEQQPKVAAMNNGDVVLLENVRSILRRKKGTIDPSAKN